MSYIGKFNPNDDTNLKKPCFRKPLKNRIPDFFQDDLVLGSFNPFSEQLTPWNGSSKLQASINLLKKEAQSKKSMKNTSVEHVEPSVERIVEHNSIDYANLVFHSSIEKHKQNTNRYECPKLKISSQEVIVSNNHKDEARRFLFQKKVLSDNKNTKKIANLTIQWDQDIVYNPQKKYFEEQNLKKKILRQFSHTRNENRNQISKKELKSEEKLFKLEFKNSKLNKKEVSIFQFKKKDFSIQLQKNKDIKKRKTPFLQTLTESKTDPQSMQVKVSNLNFEPNSSIQYLNDQQVAKDHLQEKPFRSDKWKFRTSLKAKRTVSIDRSNLKKESKFDGIQRMRHSKEGANQQSDQEIINRVTLELRQNIKNEFRTPIQIFTKTSPHFFKKTFE